MSDFSELKEHLTEVHSATPQRQWEALTALEMIKQGLVKLASLGHVFDLVQGELATPSEWPRMFYHPEYGTIIVHSLEAAQRLSPGWSDKPIGWKEQEGEAAPVEPAVPPPAPVSVNIVALVEQGKIVPEDNVSPTPAPSHEGQ